MQAHPIRMPRSPHAAGLYLVLLRYDHASRAALGDSLAVRTSHSRRQPVSSRTAATYSSVMATFDRCIVRCRWNYAVVGIPSADATAPTCSRRYEDASHAVFGSACRSLPRIDAGSPYSLGQCYILFPDGNLRSLHREVWVELFCCRHTQYGCHASHMQQACAWSYLGTTTPRTQHLGQLGWPYLALATSTLPS